MQVVFDMKEQAKYIHACKRVVKLLKLKVVSQQKFKRFYETDHVTRCKASQNLFHSAEVWIKVLTWNSGLKCEP